jgi:hypothetical protein
MYPSTHPRVERDGLVDVPESELRLGAAHERLDVLGVEVGGAHAVLRRLRVVIEHVRSRGAVGVDGRRGRRRRDEVEGRRPRVDGALPLLGAVELRAALLVRRHLRRALLVAEHDGAGPRGGRGASGSGSRGGGGGRGRGGSSGRGRGARRPHRPPPLVPAVLLLVLVLVVAVDVLVVVLLLLLAVGGGALAVEVGHEVLRVDAALGVGRGEAPLGPPLSPLAGRERSRLVQLLVVRHVLRKDARRVVVVVGHVRGPPRGRGRRRPSDGGRARCALARRHCRGATSPRKERRGDDLLVLRMPVVGHRALGG